MPLLLKLDSYPDGRVLADLDVYSVTITLCFGALIIPVWKTNDMTVSFFVLHFSTQINMLILSKAEDEHETNAN